MTINNSHVTIGEETTYGSAVTPARSFEARSDPWQPETERVLSPGFLSLIHI